MTLKLSDDLAQELARNGDQPLALENPRNQRLYVLVAVDKYAISPHVQPSEESTSSGWSEADNLRRFELIDREIAAQLTPAEAVELAQLQRRLDAHLQQIAPLPLSALKELHGRLLAQARASDESGS